MYMLTQNYRLNSLNMLNRPVLQKMSDIIKIVRFASPKATPIWFVVLSTNAPKNMGQASKICLIVIFFVWPMSFFEASALQAW